MSQDSRKKTFQPGPIALFGSGETSPSGRKVFEFLFQNLPDTPQIALLETPAGFELNSAQVVGHVGEFLEHSLQNFDPHVEIIPARKRGTYHSPNNPKILSPLLSADLIFLGPGSPTYAVRQLRDSMAWQMLIAHHCLGGAIALASAAAIAISRLALPVYEIYKVGEDLHWKEGLDFFGLYGPPLVFIPHWNNQDGGEELDTSRCFMGVQRFYPLINMLPANMTLLGIDELTALIIDPALGECRVIGKGNVTLIGVDTYKSSYKGTSDLNALDQATYGRTFQEGETFQMTEIGMFHYFDPGGVLPRDVWLQALIAKNFEVEEEEPPENILRLVHEREKARSRRNWEIADNLRDDLASLGWEVIDTPDGPQLNRSVK